MKLIYIGGQTANTGTYFDLRDAHSIHVKERSVLPGSLERKYIRIPELLSLMLAPLIGLLYIIVMPFVGMVVIIYLLCVKTVTSLKDYITNERGK